MKIDIYILERLIHRHRGASTTHRAASSPRRLNNTYTRNGFRRDRCTIVIHMCTCNCCCFLCHLHVTPNQSSAVVVVHDIILIVPSSSPCYVRYRWSICRRRPPSPSSPACSSRKPSLEAVAVLRPRVGSTSRGLASSDQRGSTVLDPGAPVLTYNYRGWRNM